MSERQRTRDLLLEYNLLPTPHAQHFNIIYPWENKTILAFFKQLFTLAKYTGFEGEESDFKQNFGSYLQNNCIIYANYINFPETGELNKLYFDLEDKILYYWDNEYIPINTMLIENTILNGGNAEE